MTIEKLLIRLETFDELVKNEKTGTPEECAQKLGLSRRQFFRFKKDLENKGAELMYSKVKESYFYTGKSVFEMLLQGR